MVDDMLTRQTLMHSTIPKGPHNLANFPYPKADIHEVVYHVQDACKISRHF